MASSEVDRPDRYARSLDLHRQFTDRGGGIRRRCSASREKSSSQMRCPTSAWPSSGPSKDIGPVATPRHAPPVHRILVPRTSLAGLYRPAKPARSVISGQFQAGGGQRGAHGFKLSRLVPKRSASAAISSFLLPQPAAPPSSGRFPSNKLNCGSAALGRKSPAARVPSG
jgi:hypothetical protein